MTEKRARLIFDLTEADKAALERVRGSLGYRSHAECLRALIRHVAASPESGPMGPVALAKALEDGSMTMVEYRARVVPSALSVAARGPTVQVGPRTYKPGELAKPDRRRRR